MQGNPDLQKQMAEDQAIEQALIKELEDNQEQEINEAVVEEDLTDDTNEVDSGVPETVVEGDELVDTEPDQNDEANAGVNEEQAVIDEVHNEEGFAPTSGVDTDFDLGVKASKMEADEKVEKPEPFAQAEPENRDNVIKDDLNVKYKTIMNSQEVDVVIGKDGQRYYLTESKLPLSKKKVLKKLPKGQKVFIDTPLDEEATKVWARDFASRVSDIWIKNVAENKDFNNNFLVNAEMQFKAELANKYKVNPFIAGLVNMKDVQSGKLKTLIHMNRNIQKVYQQRNAYAKQGYTTDEYETIGIGMDHEMFHIMDQVFSNEPEYAKLREEAVKVVSEYYLNNGTEKQRDRYAGYLNSYIDFYKERGIDPLSPKSQQAMRNRVSEEMLADMWSLFQLGNTQFKSESGIMGMFFKKWNDILVDKSGNDGLLKIWRVANKLEIFENIAKRDLTDAINRWIENGKNIKNSPIDETMNTLYNSNYDTPLINGDIAKLNMETKQIVSKLKELDGTLVSTKNVVDKFRTDWLDFKDYHAYLTDLGSKNKKLFTGTNELNAFAMKSYIKLHPNSYEDNHSSSMFIFSNNMDGKIDMKISAYNGVDKNTDQLPTYAYTDQQIGEAHNVSPYRLVKSGWEKAKGIFGNMRARQNHRLNTNPLYKGMLEYLAISDKAILRHPDNVGVMMPVLHENLSMTTKESIKSVGEKGYFKDLDGYIISNEDRYTQIEEQSPTGEIRTYLKKDYNGELYFKQYYKFDSSIYNSRNAKDIVRSLVYAGYYPMPGSHTSMQTLDIHQLLYDVFTPGFATEYPSPGNGFLENRNNHVNAIIGDGIENLHGIESELLKYYLGSHYAQSEFGYLGKMMIQTTISNNDIDVLDIIKINHESGTPTIEMNSNAMVDVMGTKKAIWQLDQKERDTLLTAVENIKEPLENALAQATEHFAPIGNYYLNHDILPQIKKLFEGANIDKHEFGDLYIHEWLADHESAIKKFLNTQGDIKGSLYAVDKIIHDTVKDIMLDKFTAMLDQVFLTAVDAGGKSFLLTGKYNHKYISSLSHEWRSPDLKHIIDGLHQPYNGHQMFHNGGLSNQAPKGLSIKDGELMLNTYVFDPDVWKKAYPEMTEHIDKLLAVLGKQAIDGATIMLNNDPYDIHNTGKMSIQEALGLIGGVDPTGSYKNRLHIATPSGTLELKHAMHPLTFTWNGDIEDTLAGEKYQMPKGNEEFGKLVALLRKAGVGAIIMKSALKGEGTYALQYKKIDGKEYGVGVLGDIQAEYDSTTKQFVPLKTVEGQEAIIKGVPFIPIEKLFRLNDNGALAMNQAGADLIRARILQIPLTGRRGLSWGDGQKGKPHSVTGSAPFRFPSFSKNSKYMQAPAGIEGFDAFEGNANNAITNWVQNMGKHIMDLHNGFGIITDYAGNNHIANPEQDNKLLRNLLTELKDYIANRVDNERDADNDTEDEFMNQSLNYTTDTTDYKNALRMIEDVLDRQMIEPADLAPLLGMTDSIIENTFVSRMIKPQHSMTGINTVFWQMMKFKHKNLANLKGRGTMGVFVPNLDNRGDMMRMIKEAKKLGYEEQFTTEVMEMFDPETGLWKDGSQALSVSPDIMKKFKLKPGSKVFAMLVPPDSAMSVIPMRVMGLLDGNNRNAMTFNSKIALEFWGRDHDIDQISLLVNDSNWKDEKGNDGFEFLHETLTHHGFHEGKPKAMLVKAKQVLDKMKDDVDGTITIKKTLRGRKEQLELPVQNYNILSTMPEFTGEDGKNIFKNVYEPRANPVMANMDVDAPHDSRAYFSNKKIGIAASLGNKYGTLIHRYNGTIQKGSGNGFNITTRDYKTISDAMGEKSKGATPKLISGLTFRIRHSDDMYDNHFPYMKEGTVDTYSQIPIEFQPYTWLATMLVDQVSYKEDTGLEGDTAHPTVTNLKFAEIEDPVVRLYIAAQLQEMEKTELSGQFVKTIFDKEEGYSYNTIREMMHRITRHSDVSDYKRLSSSIGHVLNSDHGILVNDRFDLEQNNVGALPSNGSYRDFDSIDDIINNTFKALFFKDAQFGTDPTKGNQPRANFNTQKKQSFNKSMADFKNKMMAQATVGLQTLYHFTMMNDALLPNELFVALNPMPARFDKFGRNMAQAKGSLAGNSNVNATPGSAYFNSIDRISRMTYAWMSSFDAEYTKTANKIVSDEDAWFNPTEFVTDPGKEKSLYSMQKMFRLLNNVDADSPYSGTMVNELLGETFLDPIMNTILDAEINDNNKTSMIFHKDNDGNYIYTESNPLPISFVTYPDGQSTMESYSGTINIRGAWNPDTKRYTEKKMQAQMYLNKDNVPMVYIVYDGQPLKVNGTSRIPITDFRDTHKLKIALHKENPQHRFEDNYQLARIMNNLVEAFTLGGKAYAEANNSNIKSHGSISLIGAIPNKASHKQNFIKLVYTNMVKSLGNFALKNPKLLQSMSNLYPENTEQVVRDLVAGMVMAHPLGGESFNTGFGARFGNPLPGDVEFKDNQYSYKGTYGGIVDQLQQATNQVIKLHGGNANFAKQLQTITGVDTSQQKPQQSPKVENVMKNINSPNMGNFMATDFTAKKTPGEIMSYLALLEDIAMRYSKAGSEQLQSPDGKGEMLNEVAKTLTILKDIHRDIINVMAPHANDGKNDPYANNKNSWVHMEELFNNHSFMFTALGQKVMQELNNQGITPKVRYDSVEHGKLHDLRDMAADLMREYARNGSDKQEVVLPSYSIFDDMVKPYDGISSIVNKVPIHVRAFRIMESIVGWFRKNSTINSHFKTNLEKFIKGKTFSDGTPMTFENLFGYRQMMDGLTMGADKDVRGVEIAEIMKQYFYNELADLHNIPPAERKVIYANWDKTDIANHAVTAEDYIARLAFEQLKAISNSSAMILRAAMNDFSINSEGRFNTTAFMNKHAENITEMFHVLKEYKNAEKYKLKQLNDKNMTIEEAHKNVAHAIKMNLNITRRNSPEALAKNFSTQKVLANTSVFSLPTLEVNENGELVPGTPIPIALNGDQMSPNMFLGSTGANHRDLEVTDTARIILGYADTVFDMVRQSERAVNETTEALIDSIGKITPEQEAEYDGALKQILQVLPDYFGADFKVKFKKIDGRIIPIIEFKHNKQVISGGHNSTGNRWSDVQNQFILEAKNRIPDKLLPRTDMIDQALKNWLSMKLVAAMQGVNAQRYIGVLNDLIGKLNPNDVGEFGTLNDPYIKQFETTRDELQQIVDLTLFKVQREAEGAEHIKVSNKEAFNYLPGSSANMTSMKLNALTKLESLRSAIGEGKLLENEVTMKKIAKLFNVANDKYENKKTDPAFLLKLLESAIGYIKRQDNVDHADEQYTMKDRMVGAMKRTGLTMSNRIVMELLAMADTGNAVYLGSITPSSINNMNQLIDKSFNMSAYGLLAKIYDHINRDMRNLAPAFGIETNSHIDEHAIVTNEVFNQLAELRGESVAYSGRLVADKQGNYDVNIGDTVSIDYEIPARGKEQQMNYRNTKGLILDQDSNSLLVWIPAKNTFDRIAKGGIKYAKKGFAYDDEYEAYLDTVKNVLGTLALPTETIKNTLINRDRGYDAKKYDDVNAMDNQLKELSGQLTDKIYSADTPWKARMSRVRKYGIAAEALGGYQGGMKLIGSVVAGATGLGAFAIGNPIAGSALVGYSLKQFVGYVGKQGTAIGQNYGSALLRELLPINGLFKTITSAIHQSTKDSGSDTQSSITNAISTFIKDEVAQKQMMSDMDRTQVNNLLDILSRANNSLTGNINLDNALNRYASGEITYKQIRATAVEALDKAIVPENDYVSFWLKNIDFDPESRQYLLKNGHDVNSLLQLKHNIIKDKITNILTFGQIIAKSEEGSKKLGSKVFAKYLDEERIVSGASQNEVSTIIDRFMDRSAGNYKSNKRLSKNKHGFNQLLTLYERFNRDNNAYYLNDVYKAIDKSLSIDYLSSLLGTYGKTGRGTYATIKGMESYDGELSRATIAYNIDEMSAYKKKLVLATTMAVMSTLAKAGLLLLAGLTMNEELTKNLKAMFSELDSIDTVERSTSLGGFMQSATGAALLTGTSILFDHTDMMRGTSNKSAIKQLVKDEMRNPGSILQTAGIGLGYSKIFELPLSLGNQFMLHNMRTTSPKLQKLLDSETHDYWINYTTGVTKLLGVLSLAEKLGTVGTTTVGLMMGADPYKSDLAHTIAMPLSERKKSKKKKKNIIEPIEVIR